MIYLDNNATTIMPQQVISQMVAWCNKGNASANYASAKQSRNMMSEFRELLSNICGIKACSADEFKTPAPDCNYNIIFTSGASESNCTIVNMILKSWNTATSTKPHIVTTMIEHKSILDMISDLVSRGCVTATYVEPTSTGHILPAQIENAIQYNTCLVCVMHANNETGAINDIEQIGAISHARCIPFHSDVVQTFGKFHINPIKSNVDSFSISFHKFSGPPGVGALIVKQRLVNGYSLSPMIYGTQNYGLRGGTENIPGIGASFAATKLCMQNRKDKTINMQRLKEHIVAGISKYFHVMLYKDYVKKMSIERDKYIVLMSDITLDYLPNTILLSVVSHKIKVCNARIKEALEKLGIVISVGSACNTASDKASHVLYAMKADEYIRRGALRISIGDTTDKPQVDEFVKQFANVCNSHT